MRRNSKGQILPGQEMSDEWKEKIRQGQIARYERQQAQLAGAEEPSQKRCTKCKKWKNVPGDFTMRRRTLASGQVKTYPAGECKRCTADRSARHRDKLRREGVLLAKQKEYNDKRNPTHKRAYNREWQRQRRRLAGVPERGTWRKYRHEVVELGVDPRLPRAPFDEWLAQVPMTPTELQAKTGVGEEIFRRTGGSTISLSTVDRVCVGLGIPDQVAVLYPADTSDVAA